MPFAKRELHQYMNKCFRNNMNIALKLRDFSAHKKQGNQPGHFAKLQPSLKAQVKIKRRINDCEINRKDA